MPMFHRQPKLSVVLVSSASPYKKSPLGLGLVLNVEPDLAVPGNRANHGGLDAAVVQFRLRLFARVSPWAVRCSNGDGAISVPFRNVEDLADGLDCLARSKVVHVCPFRLSAAPLLLT